MKPIVPIQIETDRLLLRIFEEADWDGLNEMFSDEDCVRHTIKTVLPKWQVWRMLAAYVGHWQMRGYGPYAVVEKTSGKMMGPVGLWYPGDWPEPEIKYSLSKKYWGKGFATEAALAVKEMAANHMNRKRLISLILPENLASISVASRLGGKFEKTIPFRDGTANVYAYDLSK
ncbi:GNAT family N-acetyltransferase [bacterium]|nr:GNAT family N-acetyltransferase [bacterium]